MSRKHEEFLKMISEINPGDKSTWPADCIDERGYGNPEERFSNFCYLWEQWKVWWRHRKKWPNAKPGGKNNETY